MGASAVLSPPASVEPGKEASCEIRVRNTGQVVDQFRIEVVGDAAAWAVVEPPTLSLFPGAEGAVRIWFRPPRSAQIRMGQHPFGVRVQSQEDPQRSVVEEATIEVAPFSDLFAELSPRTSHGRSGGRHDIAVDNRGNARVTAALTATDPDKLLSFTTQPPSLDAEPGTANFARLRVTAKNRFLSGPPKTHPFKVLVQRAGQAPLTLDGTLLQEAILPSWFWRAVIGLLVASVAAVVLWLTLLKPTLESTARAAVASPLAQIQQQLSSGAAGAAAGAGAKGTKASPSPGASAAPGATALGDPTDGRLDPKSPSFNVPANGTLFVTDLVFENPNSETGILRLQRDGNDLLILKLDNFRDLDYHFVAPIVFSGGRTLHVAVGCTGCRVYYAGYLKTQ